MSLIAPTILETLWNVVKAVARHWRAVVITVVAIVVLFAGIWLVKRIFFRPPHLNQRETERVKEHIDEMSRREMIEVLATSDAREKDIDNSIKMAEDETEKAKVSYADKSNEDLAAELERRAKENP